MKITILYSGGLDSYIMKMYAEKKYPDAEINYVWYDIGQEYNEKEKNALPSFVERRKIEWLKPGEKLLGKQESASGNIFIPGRNAVLATCAASMFLPDEIWMGALMGETHSGSTDKNYEFLEKLNDMLRYVHSPYKDKITVRFPLADEGWGKLEAVKWAYDNGASKEELMATSSCLSSEKGKCGHCVVCMRRMGIFGQLGFSEKYNVNPLLVPQNQKMILEMLKGERGEPCHYDKFRRDEIIPYLYKITGAKSNSELEDIMTNEEKIKNIHYSAKIKRK